MRLSMSSHAQPAAGPASANLVRPWLFAIAVFTSASLVFLVQPLIGKLFLPLLGGSPAIWNTSLAFFQGALLIGYGYAHLLQKAGAVRRQMIIHAAALALAAVVLPLHVTTLLGEPWDHAPATWMVLALTLTIGAPFAVLSATAPLLQAWYAKLASPGQAGDAYTLYAASNLGSLIALAAYPIVVEPLLGLHRQAMLWSLGYVGFVLLLVVLGLRIWKAPEHAADAEIPDAAPPITWKDRLVWLGLAAAPSSLLVGVTSHLTGDVASAPFLWVVPLELYLLTFVIAFRAKRGPPDVLRIAQIVLAGGAILTLGDPNMPWPQQLAAHLIAFFVITLLCHWTLAARRPHPERLTEFYLIMSIGGVLGGSFNALLAPVLFSGVWEYPAVLALSCLARPWGPRKFSSNEIAYFAAGCFWTLPLLIPDLSIPGFIRIALCLAPICMALMLRHRGQMVAVLMCLLAIGCQIESFSRYDGNYRSFFGVTHLHHGEADEMGPVRVMVHGTTLHGVQSLTPKTRCVPMSYYSPQSAIGTVFGIERTLSPALRIGAVGLGTGSVAAFVRPTDTMRFFEIDPLVVKIATDSANFSFTTECAKGPVDYVLGDARLSLAKEKDGAFDLLLIDAFSSDSVPTHLLTVEALKLYLRKTSPGGVVILHLSNRNLDLTGPAAAAAKAAGAASILGEHYAAFGVSPYIDAGGIVLLVSKEPSSLYAYRSLGEWRPASPSPRPWTDDYTNVWGAMMDRINNPR